MIKVEVKEAVKCNGEYSLFLSFEYDSKVVDVIRGLSSRYWNPNEKTWEVPLNKLPEILAKLNAYDFEITGKYVSLEEPKLEVPVDFEFKTKPYEHQVKAFHYGLTHDKWLLGDEMGLGKTKQVIDIAVAKKLQRDYKHCLIVCGVNGLKWNWANEVRTHSDEEAWILGQRRKNGKLVIGSVADRLYDLKHLNDISAYFLITNIETIRNEEIASQIKDLCASNAIQMIAFDECHKAKNPNSQQGKGILKAKAETMIAMTGTPLMNTPLDLYIILKWLGYERHSFYQFKNHYCVMGGYGNYQIVGYRNLDELQGELDRIMLRRLKEDALDLPEKTYIDEFVEMTPKQEQIYKEITNEIRANIDQIEMSANPLAALIRMRQATGYTGILSSSIQESAKLDRMEELVEEAVENGKQVVIFSNWTQMTDVIWARLHKKYRVSVITGETKDIDRQDNVNEFQSGASQVIIGTSGAMGTGLTLTAGTVEIFMDEPWNMALKEQCVDRCHRIGQKNNITIYTLMCKDTIDERIHNIVEQKGLMADAIVDGKVSESKRELLEYLIG